jgi:hypothetical protein
MGYPIFPSNVEYGDIVRGLPISNQTCKAIYCSHTLEHLALNELRQALKHTYDYLMKNGIFRFVLPDLEHLARSYLHSQAIDAAILFMTNSGLGKRERNRNFISFMKDWLGNSLHLWLWDFRGIKHELEGIGFIDIRRAEFGDSSELRFSEVEDKGRWRDCLGVECKK